MSEALKTALKTKVIYASKLTLEEIGYLRSKGYMVVLRTTTSPAPPARVSAPWIIPERFKIQSTKIVKKCVTSDHGACKVAHVLEN